MGGGKIAIAHFGVPGKKPFLEVLTGAIMELELELMGCG